MKEQENKQVSRRRFISTAAASAVAASILPLGYGCNSVTQTATTITKPNSNFGGVQIGAITYSFDNGFQTAEQCVPANVDALIKACIDSGLSSIELQAGSFGVEEYLGAPKNPTVRTRRSEIIYTGPNAKRAPGNTADMGIWGGTYQLPVMGETGAEQRMSPQQTQQQTPEQTKYAADMKAWRLSVPMTKYEELRKKFNDAGINIHILSIGDRNSDEEEREYPFKVAVAMGAKAMGGGSLLNDSYKALVPLFEKYGLKMIFHNHAEYADPNIDVDAILNYSQVCMLNFDTGHYFGSTGKDPVAFIEKYHDRIFSLHLKDKTGPDNKYWINVNQFWGQGETPIIEILQLIKKNQWPIHCDIELEYNFPPWKNAVDEVKLCVEYCRQALI